MHMNKPVELQPMTHNHKDVLKQGLGTSEEEIKPLQEWRRGSF